MAYLFDDFVGFVLFRDFLSTEKLICMKIYEKKNKYILNGLTM